MDRLFADKAVSVILLDIEGTTTPVDFVYNVLFSYARTRMESYLAQNFTSEDVQSDLGLLFEENVEDVHQGLDPPLIQDHSTEAKIESAVAYLHWLMDRDRKSTPLKSLQGKIWEKGYQTGELKSQVYADVPQAFARWRERGKKICIYSSGSALAQKLLFAHTTEGDLTKFVSEYFDTNIGAKKETESYRRIADALELSPSEILFVSDIVAELDAARSAGILTVCSIRPGNAPQPVHDHAVIYSFDDL